jgi:hypothetical protein
MPERTDDWFRFGSWFYTVETGFKKAKHYFELKRFLGKALLGGVSFTQNNFNLIRYPRPMSLTLLLRTFLIVIRY